MSTPTRVTVDAQQCEITVFHRIHFHNLGMAATDYAAAVQKAKKDLKDKWETPVFQFGFCSVKFVFEYVDKPSADADIKNLLPGQGTAYQQNADPTKRQAGAWFPENWGDNCVAAHETGHELGMEDKYQAQDANGNPVPTWIGKGADAKANPAAVNTVPAPGYSNTGLAFTTAPNATVQQQDIDEIMKKLGVECPCPIFENPPPEPEHAHAGNTTTTGNTTTGNTTTGNTTTGATDGRTTTGLTDGPSGTTTTDGKSDQPQSQEPKAPPGGLLWPETFTTDDFFTPVNEDDYGDDDDDDDDDDDEDDDDEDEDDEDEDDDDDDAPPLFFVPGIMGSALCKVLPNGDRERIWPVKTFAPSLDPLYPGANTKAATALYPGVYDPLIEFILRPTDEGGLGRVLHVDFFIFPYDWTQSNRDSGEAFRAEIAAVLAAANASRVEDGLEPWTFVDVICHSMGGLVTRMANLLGAPIRKTCYLATPHYGAPAAYFMLHPDIEASLGLSLFEHLMASVAWALLSKQENPTDLNTALANLAEALPSVWELLPDTFYLTPLAALRVRYNAVVDEHGVTATYLNGPWKFIGHDAEIGDAMDFKEALGPTPPDEMLLIINDVLKTPTYVVYDRSSRQFETPKARRIGDETVPEFSGRAGGAATVVPGNHTQIPNDKLTFLLIKGFIPSG